MYKIYLLLVSGVMVAGTASGGSLLLHKSDDSFQPTNLLQKHPLLSSDGGTVGYSRRGEPQANNIIKALQQFGSTDTAVKINAEYSGWYADENRILELSAYDVIRGYIYRNDKTNTISYLNKTQIFFSHTLLKEGSYVSVTATYVSISRPFTPLASVPILIYVGVPGGSQLMQANYWQTSSRATSVDIYGALNKFNSLDTAIQIDARYAGKYADDYQASATEPRQAGDVIRDYMVSHNEAGLIDKEELFFVHTLLRDDADVFSVLVTYSTASGRILLADILVHLTHDGDKDEALVQHKLARVSAPGGYLLSPWDLDESKEKIVYTDSEVGSNKIRNSIILQLGLAPDLVAKLTFGHDVLLEGTGTDDEIKTIWKWSTVATFGDVQVKIYGDATYFFWWGEE